MMRSGWIVGMMCILALGLGACGFSGAAATGNDNNNANDIDNANQNGSGDQSAREPFGFSLKIARHVDQPLTETEVDTIFAIATSLLQRKDFECPDVACPVTFGRSGAVEAFDTGSNVITSESALDDVFDLPGDIKVVTSMVGVCGVSAVDDTAVILGCAFTGGSVVIVREADPDVWAHEWGHVQGLDHRDNCPRNLMHSFELQTNAVSDGECAAFLTPTPAALSFSLRQSDDARVFIDHPSQSVDPSLRRFDESRRDWLERIVAPRYIAGLPAGAIRYCNDDQVCGELARMAGEIDTPNQRQNIIRGLGLTGNPQAVDTVLGVLDGATGEMSVGQFNVYAEALLAAGRLANVDDSGAALAYLQQAAFDDFWETRQVRLDSQAPLSEAMSSIAIKALGLADRIEASDYLAAMMATSAVPAHQNELSESLGSHVPGSAAPFRVRDNRQP